MAGGDGGRWWREVLNALDGLPKSAVSVPAFYSLALLISLPLDLMKLAARQMPSRRPGSSPTQDTLKRQYLRQKVWEISFKTSKEKYGCALNSLEVSVTYRNVRGSNAEGTWQLTRLSFNLGGVNRASIAKLAEACWWSTAWYITLRS